jgi:hypothetical protein
VVLRQGQRFGVFSAIGAPGGAMQHRSGAIDTPKMVPVVSRSASLTWWWDASGNRPATGPVGDNRRRRSVRWVSADDRVRQTKTVSVAGNEAEGAADSSGARPIQTRSGLLLVYRISGCSVATAQVAGCGVVAGLGSRLPVSDGARSWK